MRTADVMCTAIMAFSSIFAAQTIRASENHFVDSSEMVHSISDKDFAEKALANGVCVVEFSSNWCHPCRELKPIYERVAGECKGAKFYQFQIEDGTKADETYHVTKMPCVIIFRNGHEVARKLGHELLVDGAREKFVAWVGENEK